MKVYWDAYTDTLRIEGIARPFPARSLTASRVGDALEIWTRGVTTRIVGPIAFDRVRNVNGTPFASPELAESYLTSEFDKIRSVEVSQRDGNDLTLEPDGLFVRQGWETTDW